VRVGSASGTKGGTLGSNETVTQVGTVMTSIIKAFFKDESGATAIEYGLIAAGISVAIITAVNGLGTKINSNFQNISSSLK
jgi:pilus assembly protein Flp/PilA